MAVSVDVFVNCVRVGSLSVSSVALVILVWRGVRGFRSYNPKTRDSWLMMTSWCTACVVGTASALFSDAWVPFRVCVTFSAAVLTLVVLSRPYVDLKIDTRAKR